jgi:hypothetical protein
MPSRCRRDVFGKSSAIEPVAAKRREVPAGRRPAVEANLTQGNQIPARKRVMIIIITTCIIPWLATI